MSDVVIHSRLYKSSYLVGNSQVFPNLVQAACAWVDAPFTPDAVRWCATRPAVIDALQMTKDVALDEVLLGFAADPAKAKAMDDLIIAAAAEWKVQVSDA